MAHSSEVQFVSQEFLLDGVERAGGIIKKKSSDEVLDVAARSIHSHKEIPLRGHSALAM